MAYDQARLEQALVNADKAGDTEAATAFANEIRKMRGTPKKEMSWGDAALSGVSNIPKGIGNLVSGLGQAVMHPIDTAGNVMDLAAGGLQNVLPEKLVNAVNTALPNERADTSRQKADAFGDIYKQRYGSSEGFKQAVADDPVSIMADAATALTLGGGAASKIPGLNKIGQASVNAGRTIDPLRLVAKGAKAATKGAGNVAAEVIGGLGTHTGGASIKTAARAGYQGGVKQQIFRDNLRGNVPMTDVLDEAKAAVDNMRVAKSAEYRAGMAGVKADKTILDMQPILDKLDDAKKISTFKGKTLNPSTAKVRTEISSKVKEWAAENPADFHTPEGLDALKQAIGDIRDSTDFGSPARLVANDIYHSIKNQITKQAPEYAKVMKGYSESSDLIKEVERALSLGHKAAADTSMRKLQSLTRNNVNTNFSNRVDLAKNLEKSGAPNLMDALSGQSLNAWAPRGIGGATALGTGGVSGGLGFLMGGPVGAALMGGSALAAQSPRLMGEAALKTGQLARILSAGPSKAGSLMSSVGIDPVILANYLAQAGRER